MSWFLKEKEKYKYKVLEDIYYVSKRYSKTVKVEKGFKSDGATGARDIFGDVTVKIIGTKNTRLVSKAFLIHDKLCDTGKFYDGTLCPNWKASQILSDILLAEGHKYRAKYWFWSTYLFGGGLARKNGMINLK